MQIKPFGGSDLAFLSYAEYNAFGTQTKYGKSAFCRMRLVAANNYEPEVAFEPGNNKVICYAVKDYRFTVFSSFAPDAYSYTTVAQSAESPGVNYFTKVDFADMNNVLFTVTPFLTASGSTLRMAVILGVNPAVSYPTGFYVGAAGTYKTASQCVLTPFRNAISSNDISTS